MERYVVWKKFFSSDGTKFVGIGNRFPHNTSILSVQITCQSINHWLVSAQRSLSSQVQHYIFRRHYNSARSSLKVFRVHCCNFFVDDLRSCIRIQVYRSYLNILSVNVPLIKASCSLFLYFGNIFRLEWYNA